MPTVKVKDTMIGQLCKFARDCRTRIKQRWNYVCDAWNTPAPPEIWEISPLQVCPMCGFTERATRATTARSNFMNLGRSQVSVKPVFTFNFCRLCAVQMVRECSECGNVIRDEHATCCWQCGRAYSWARMQQWGDWKHFAEVLWTQNLRTIWLYVGDITSLHVDAIVSPDDYHGRMRGEVASRILQAAGDTVGHEVGRKREPGEAWETEAGNLTMAGNARRIIHVAAMQLDGKCDPKAVMLATTKALEKGKELNLRQIAFPAIGTGSGGLEMSTSVPKMFSGMKTFLENKSGSVNDIVCVVLDDNRANQFKESLKQPQTLNLEKELPATADNTM